ncbi:hypothetical protein [Lutibacter citreus]|uniref:hypothetical protein n=1 Tax=Lutibacter citreus TaxID=2138210 RepID=UPI000DBE28DA|nr:hypothetical protein [Lutibacter citreus]
MGYPGSSSDCIDLFFKQTSNGYSYYLEFNQTNSPENDQNLSVLELLKSLKDPLVNKFGFSYESKPDNKIFTFIPNRKKENYETIEELLVDVEKDLTTIIPLVDKYILKEQKRNPDFVAHRITQKEFCAMKNKLERRLKKYSNIKDMLFNKVTLENVKTAVNDLKEKGIPDGFNSSKYYDVKIDGTLYPSKPIMAIANYYATGRKVENYFSGGINTPCFKAYERLGIEIVTKSNNMDPSQTFLIVVSKELKDDRLHPKV